MPRCSSALPARCPAAGTWRGGARASMRWPGSTAAISGGIGQRRSGRRSVAAVTMRPSTCGARPRRVVSTSGSSGMPPAYYSRQDDNGHPVPPNQANATPSPTMPPPGEALLAYALGELEQAHAAAGGTRRGRARGRRIARARLMRRTRATLKLAQRHPRPRRRPDRPRTAPPQHRPVGPARRARPGRNAGADAGRQARRQARGELLKQVEETAVAARASRAEIDLAPGPGPGPAAGIDHRAACSAAGSGLAAADACCAARRAGR